MYYLAAHLRACTLAADPTGANLATWPGGGRKQLGRDWYVRVLTWQLPFPYSLGKYWP